ALLFSFFFQAEDGIRDRNVTGVQTCALPIFTHELRFWDKLPAMPFKTEKELRASLHALWLKAVAAIELRNFGYTISLLQEILKQEPEFLTGRQLLRRAEVTKTQSAKKSFFNISTAS